MTFSVSVLCGGGDGGSGGWVNWEDNPGYVPLTAGGWPFVYLQSVPTIVFSCPDVCIQHFIQSMFTEHLPRAACSSTLKGTSVQATGKMLGTMELAFCWRRQIPEK